MNFLIVFAAQYLFFVSIIIVGWFFVTLKNNLKKKFITLSLVSSVFTFAVAKLLGVIFNDPRPFVTDHIRPLISHAADNGFPSDHTLLTMVIASVVFVYNRKLGILLAVISFIVGFSRVLAGIHHPIDILGAMIIAIIAVVGTKRLITFWLNRKNLYCIQ